MIDIFVPMKTVSEANLSEHWSKKYKRSQIQQWSVKCFLKNSLYDKNVQLPLKILMIRRGKRKMDFDNLTISLKHVRDAIAHYLLPGFAAGMADNDPRLSFEYGQLPTKNETGVWIILW